MGALIVPFLLIFGGAAALAFGHEARAIAGAGIFIIFLALPGFLIPLYVWLRLSLVAPAFIIDMKGILGSLSRSWDLQKGNLLKTLGVIAVVGIVISIIESIITAPFTIPTILSAFKGTEPSRGFTVLYTIVSAIVSSIFAPINSIVIILLYYDMRIRKEGFDLELLARDLSASAEQSYSHGAASLPQEQLPPQPQYPEEKRGEERERQSEMDGKEG